jgi:hypothetical protein
MSLKPGKQNDLSGSMADDMMKAFKKAWKEYKGVLPPEISSEYLQPIFIAIAQGVIKHLRDNASALKVIDVSVDQVNSLILSAGDTGNQISTGYGKHKHNLTISQVYNEDHPDENKVHSEGIGRIEIETEGIY